MCRERVRAWDVLGFQIASVCIILNKESAGRRDEERCAFLSSQQQNGRWGVPQDEFIYNTNVNFSGTLAYFLYTYAEAEQGYM